MSHSHHHEATAFLDANILVSAAWKLDSETAKIWKLAGLRLVTSSYVVGEVQRNLHHISQIERLRSLMTQVEILTFEDLPAPEELQALPAKDRPVMAAAIKAGADFLITGDKKHFSQWFGKSVCGVRVEPTTNLIALFPLRT